MSSAFWFKSGAHWLGRTSGWAHSLVGTNSVSTSASHTIYIILPDEPEFAQFDSSLVLGVDTVRTGNEQGTIDLPQTEQYSPQYLHYCIKNIYKIIVDLRLLLLRLSYSLTGAIVLISKPGPYISGVHEGRQIAYWYRCCVVRNLAGTCLRHTSWPGLWYWSI